MDLQEHVIEERTPLGNNGFRRMSGLTGYREALYPDNGFIIQEVDHCPLPQAEKTLVPVFAGTVSPTGGGLKECLECSVCQEIGLFFKVSCSRIFIFLDDEAYKTVSPITFREFNLWRAGTKRWPCTECDESCKATINKMAEEIGSVALDIVEGIWFPKPLGELGTA